MSPRLPSAPSASMRTAAVVVARRCARREPLRRRAPGVGAVAARRGSVRGPGRRGRSWRSRTWRSSACWSASAYSLLLQKTRPVVATSYVYADSVIAVVLGAAFAGERLGLASVAGAAIVLAAVVLVGVTRARRVVA